MKAVETAIRFIEQHYPDSIAAFLAGSVVRGDETPTSDLDMVVIVKAKEKFHRRSFVFEGWPVEVFANTEESFLNFFKKEPKRGFRHYPGCAQKDK